jgi:hypothetical protein
MREDTDPAADLLAEDGSGEGADDDLDLDPEFGAAEGETPEGLEAAIAEALDAQGPEEFFARLLGGVGRLAAQPARATRRQSARVRRRGARPASQEGASGRTGTRGSLTEVMRRLGRYLAEGIDEGEALDDLTDYSSRKVWTRPYRSWVASPHAPSCSHSPPGASGLRCAGNWWKAPHRRRGPWRDVPGPRPCAPCPGSPRASAIPPGAAMCGPAALPQALRRTAVQVASQPALLARLMRPGRSAAPSVRAWVTGHHSACRAGTGRDPYPEASD